jgi:hypothetical protein
MKSAGARRGFVLVILLSSAAFGASSRLEFVTPRGFVSLKDPLTEPALRNEAQGRAEAATSDAYAVRVRDGVAIATFAAKVHPGGTPLSTWEEYLKRSLAASPFAKDARIVSTKPVRLAGVDCVIADIERLTQGVAYRERYYALPSSDHWASVKLLARTAEFAAAAASVEEALQRTKGISPSTERDPLADGLQRATLFKGSAMVLVGAFLANWLSRRWSKRGPKRGRTSA